VRPSGAIGKIWVWVRTSSSFPLSLSLYIHIHMYVSLSRLLSIYIYIYILWGPEPWGTHACSGSMVGRGPRELSFRWSMGTYFAFPAFPKFSTVSWIHGKLAVCIGGPPGTSGEQFRVTCSSSRTTLGRYFDESYLFWHYVYGSFASLAPAFSMFLARTHTKLQGLERINSARRF